jgi:hypothetical protein
MSAYIVEDITINRVVSYLLCDQLASAYVERKLAEAGIDLNALGQHMLDLNIRAVDYRYDETNEGRALVPALVPVSRIQALKSLRCWLYQCSEGDIPEEPLFQIMNGYSDDLAYTIVSELPAYERAEWG